MLTCKWTRENEWKTLQMVPYRPISLMSASSVIQYVTSCFEGMKLFRGDDSRLRLFRPQLNCECSLNSALGASLPAFDPEEMLNLIKMIYAHEAPRGLPTNQPDSFLYIHPTLFTSESSLGFEIPREAQLVVILSH